MTFSNSVAETPPMARTNLHRATAATPCERGMPALRPNRVWLAVALALAGPYALAQPAQPEPQAQNTRQASDTMHTLDEVTVIGSAEEEKKIGISEGADQELIERRNASHMSDLIDQISGTSVNSLYARPEVSVGVQGIAGHGRVAQSLEGITQNFHAFTKDIGQTGSIFVDPQFLKSIDVTRGVNSSTGSLGSLGGAVDFKYLDLDDILLPDRSMGGMVRGSTGFSKYANGQKTSGSAFLASRTERWDFMLGASDSENDAYSVGSHFNEGDMLRYTHAKNFGFWLNDGAQQQSPSNCRYSGILGMSGGFQDGFHNCQFNKQQVQWLKQAAKSGALTGTEKEGDSQMLRVRHYFNDAYDQSLELFATTSHAKYQTDQEPEVWVPTDGGNAYWGKKIWSVGAELDNQVISLKYKGAFSDWVNPEVHFYHEKQEREQRWTGVPGSYGMGEPMHYFVENASNGLKISNASHFDAPQVGPLRLDTGLELRRTDKEVDSLTEDQWYQKHQQSLGYDYKELVWDPDSRNDTLALALALSTEDSGPWQASVGVGWQRVSMDVYSPMFESGNITKAGTLPTYGSLRNLYRSQGYSSSEARQMALAAASEYIKDFHIDDDSGDTRYISDNQKHNYNLKSANFGLQYTRPGSGLTTYASIGYGERAPTSNEMYINGVWMRQGFTANPDLEPEKNISLQLGANYQRAGWLAREDKIDVGVGFYRNHIRNYIGYGPIVRSGEPLNEQGGTQVANSYVANVNNLETVIRQGFELNLAYRQPLFYLRGNLTIPLRHDNKMCSWQSPSGQAYYRSTDTDDNTVYTPMGKGKRLCYSGWNWMETSLIEPIRGSLTAALTPYEGKLELGATTHFRGKQRAAYYYVDSVQSSGSAHPGNSSSAALPSDNGWIDAYLWPRVVKLDLFANYRFNEQLKVGLYLANLTDEMEATPTTLGYNFYPGRTLTGNLEYRF
ncbi:TonB-dependent receptor domain-containing protein [Stutzerimonas kirkiae]|uniref:TonB-dependent receptor domain-containing protein n=1 Tax=Stutzerimonas kirkiae TaxID=2211392 RepID=UPI00103848E9|nr:TonB-dependent receptor [Stutzerimonas kirkiae]